jgi:hypothetical protein
MAKRLYGRFFLLAIAASGVQCASVQSPARFSAFDDSNFEGLLPRKVIVWLPPGYDSESTRRYPVLYMHDGQNLFDPSRAYGGRSWEAHTTAERLIREGKIEPFILVGIDNSVHRFREYAPQKPLETVPDSVRMGLRPQMREGPLLADQYLKWISDSLVPSIDLRYRTKARAECRAMAGSSMGGLISLYGLCEYPELFGSAACLSTHWPIRLDSNSSVFRKAFEPYLFDKLGAASAPKPRVYFDRGSATLDRFYPPHQTAIDSCFEYWEYPDDRWLSLKFEGAEHNEQAWAARFDGVLLWLFPNRQIRR